MIDFNSLNLHPAILKALKEKGYVKPTSIQQQAIPPLMEGHDLLGIAQTGTGKTAAFSLPIIHSFLKTPKRVASKQARALILTPTRELASQINENIIEYSAGFKLTSTVVFGGVGKTPQIKILNKGIDVLVATPGRLLDLMNEGHINFSQLEIFVLDEADRMLDMGFIRDIKKIIAKLPKKKQTLLFSATMPSAISSLAHSLLNKPVKVEITPQATTVEKIDQSLMYIDKTNKRPLLKSVLQDPAVKSVLVFTKTKHGADRVVKYLSAGNLPCAAIHGNKSQGARERALQDFRSEKINILVATDIAARGIDVSQVTHVINFDLPMEAESYVHRIGRTARAGREGVAISFCDETEVKLLKAIEKFIRYKIPIQENLPSFEKMSPGKATSEKMGREKTTGQKSTVQKSTVKKVNRSPAAKGDEKKSFNRNRKRKR